MKSNRKTDAYETPYRLVRNLIRAVKEDAYVEKHTQELDKFISRDKRKIRALKIELSKKKL